MSLLGRFIEQRASPENPRTSLADPDSWLWDALGARRSDTGVAVNERTAMQSTAVFACVRVLAETLASLPLPVYRRIGNGKEIARDHPNYRILHDRTNPEMSSFTFRETLQGHLALWGNAYAEIETAKSGRVLALWPLRPDVTRPFRLPNGQRAFRTTIDGEQIELPEDRVMHIPALGFDGLLGYSPVALFRQSIGLALATEEFGAKFFGNGSRPGGILTHPGKLNKDAKERLKEGWTAAYGGLTNAQRVAVLEEGVTWTQLGIPPEEAQFLETRKFQVTEIARIYRVPPHMLADLERATFSNIEHQSIDFVVHTVRPWLVRWEQAMAWSLFSERDQGVAFAEFQVEGLLRGDSQQRAAFYTSLFNIAVFSPNDVRERENLNPVEGGEKRFVPLNMVPLALAGEPATLTPQRTAPEPQQDAQTPQPAARAAHAAAIERLIADVAERMHRRELVQARRALKRGRDGFAAWVDEFYAEHRETVERALEPVLGAVALFAGTDPESGARWARHHAAALAAGWTHEAASELRRLDAAAASSDWEPWITRLLDTWDQQGAQRHAPTAAVQLDRAIDASRTLPPGRAA